MIRSLAEKLTAMVIASDHDDDVNPGIYVYGFEIIIGKAITYTLMMTAGLMLGLVWEMLVYMVFLMLLRGQTGGYHFQKETTCIICSVCSGICSVLLAKTLDSAHASAFLTLPVLLSVCYIVKHAPINHPNLRITFSEAQKCRKFTKAYLGIELLTVMILIILKTARSVPISGCLAIIVAAVLMAVARIKKQEVVYDDKDERDHEAEDDEFGGARGA